MVRSILAHFRKPGTYLENKLAKYSWYRRLVGGEWAYVDGHWLEFHTDGYVIDACGRNYFGHKFRRHQGVIEKYSLTRRKL